MMYAKLIDTVVNIVRTYGVEVLSENRFWSILSDSYSFASDYALRDEFRKCISSGAISSLVQCRGDKKKTIDFITKEVNVNKGKDSDALTACLFSIAISLGSCGKSDYYGFKRSGNRQGQSTPPSPSPLPSPSPHKPNRNPQRTPPSGESATVIIMPVLLGLIALFGGSLIYIWFLFEDLSMFWMICLVAILQLGTCRGFMSTMDGNWPEEVKIKAYSCYLPIFVGFILNSLVPLLLINDQVADSLYSYFSADFIPPSYYVEDTKYSFSYQRIVPEVGFWGTVGALGLGFSLFSCAFGTMYIDCNIDSPRYAIKWRYTLLTLCVIVMGYWYMVYIPLDKLHSKEADHATLVSENQRLYNVRKDIVRDLSVKGIPLGVSMETAAGYIAEAGNGKRPKAFNYDFALKNIEDLLDGFINLRYYKVFPYTPSSGNFHGIHVSGTQYVTTTTIDNQEVSLEVDGDDGYVGAIVIKPSGGGQRFKRFQSLLDLYTTKYGKPEIILDFSEIDVLNSYSSLNGDKRTDRYIWRFQNGTIQLTEVGILYISSAYIGKIQEAYSKEKEACLHAVQLKKEQEQKARLRKDSIEEQKKIQERIRRAHNHKNAINDI